MQVMSKKLEQLRAVTFKHLPLLNNSRTSLIRTPKGQSEVSILEMCPYKRGHYDENFERILSLHWQLSVLEKLSVSRGSTVDDSVGRCLLATSIGMG